MPYILLLASEQLIPLILPSVDHYYTESKPSQCSEIRLTFVPSYLIGIIALTPSPSTDPLTYPSPSTTNTAYSPLYAYHRHLLGLESSYTINTLFNPLSGLP